MSKEHTKLFNRLKPRIWLCEKFRMWSERSESFRGYIIYECPPSRCKSWEPTESSRGEDSIISDHYFLFIKVPKDIHNWISYRTSMSHVESECKDTGIEVMMLLFHFHSEPRRFRCDQGHMCVPWRWQDDESSFASNRIKIKMYLIEFLHYGFWHQFIFAAILGSFRSKCSFHTFTVLLLSL